MARDRKARMSKALDAFIGSDEAAGAPAPTPVPHDTPTDIADDAPPHTPPTVYTPVPEQTYTAPSPPPPTPRPEANMVRVQSYLRPDQRDWLDDLAEATGKGVTRSDWIRYAVDLLRSTMERTSE